LVFSFSLLLTFSFALLSVGATSSRRDASR
jgi:hypothetical protein